LLASLAPVARSQSSILSRRLRRPILACSRSAYRSGPPLRPKRRSGASP